MSLVSLVYLALQVRHAEKYQRAQISSRAAATQNSLSEAFRVRSAALEPNLKCFAPSSV
jgi:hypothetical protein